MPTFRLPRALRIAGAIIFALFLVMALVVGFAPAATASAKSIPAAGILAIVAFALWTLACRVLAPRVGVLADRHSWLLPTIVGIGVFVLFFAELAIGRSVTETASAWDTDATRIAAEEIAATWSLDPGTASYFALWPNNAGVVVVMGAVIRFAHLFGVIDSMAIAIVFDAVLLTATVVVTVFIAYRRLGRRGAAASALLASILIGLSPWVAVPYSDTLGVLFPVLALGLGYCATTSSRLASRLLFAVGAALAVALGAFIKPSALVLVIAAVIVVLIAFLVLKRGRPALALVAAVSVVVVGATTLGLSSLGSAVTLRGLGDAADGAAMPVEYFALTGLSVNADQDPPSWGSWNSFDYGTMVNLGTADARRDYARATVVQRLKDMGAPGYAGFLAAKSRWVLSDGTFGLFYEGNRGATATTFTDPLSSKLRSFILREHGPISYGTFAQAAWLVVLASIGLRVISRFRGRFDLVEFTIVVALAGTLAYTLLGEGRARYLFLFAPLFVLLASSFLGGPLFARKSPVREERHDDVDELSVAAH